MSGNGISSARAYGSEPAFERRDAPPRGIVYAVIGLFVGLGLSALFVAAMLYTFGPEHPTGQIPPEGPRLASRTPPLELAPTAEGAAVRAQAEQ